MPDVEVNNETQAVSEEDSDDNDVPMERHIFSLGMRFSNATTTKESIIQYGLTMGVTLKYVKNDSTRVKVKCAEDRCPFVFLVSKYGSNSILVIKTLVEEYNHQLQRIMPT